MTIQTPHRIVTRTSVFPLRDAQGTPWHERPRPERVRLERVEEVVADQPRTFRAILLWGAVMVPFWAAFIAAVVS